MKTRKFIIQSILLVVIIVLLSHPEWLPLSETTSYTMKELISTYFGGTVVSVTFAQILAVVLMVCIIWLVCSVLTFIIRSVTLKRSRTQTVASLALSLIKFAGVLAGLIWGLTIIGVNVNTILASLGIVGLIVGFGAQSLIEDVITGIFIIFEGQYDIGDVIVLGDFRGTVKSINVRTTVIEDTGGNLKIINNSDIRNLQNRSKNASLAISEVGVSYNTDIRKLEKVIAENMPKMYEAHKDLYLNQPKYLGVQQLADSSVVLRFSVDVDENNIFMAQRMLNRDLKLMLDENGRIDRSFIRSASYPNWPALTVAVQGDIIPHFPLINKSFELCYACIDR